MILLSLVLALADPTPPPAPAVPAVTAAPAAPADHCKPDAPSVEHPCLDLEHRRLRFAPIVFDIDKSTLRPTSRPILEELVALILRHPELSRLEIRNHRDHVLSEHYGHELTANRARAIMSYLIQRGVPPQRLSARGYADTQPLVRGRSPLNRRTEIVILDPPTPQ